MPLETDAGEVPLKPDELIELIVFIHPTHCDVVSPQVPGASAVGQSETAAIGNFITRHGARLGVRVTRK